MSNNHPIPFWGKTKPVAHYFHLGVVRFYMREGKLNYMIRKITKTSWATLMKGEVKSKAQLDQLMSIKSLDEIHSIEVVA